MVKKGIGEGSLRLIFRSLLLWTTTALLLLTLASFYLSRSGLGSDVIGYVSSGISFLCAVAAGAAAAKKNGDKPLLQGLLTAVFLVITLLTLGFLARGLDLNGSGILSVVTFTISGVLFGLALFRSRRRKGSGRSLKKSVMHRKG